MDNSSVLHFSAKIICNTLKFIEKAKKERGSNTKKLIRDLRSILRLWKVGVIRNESNGNVCDMSIYNRLLEENFWLVALQTSHCYAELMKT